MHGRERERQRCHCAFLRGLCPEKCYPAARRHVVGTRTMAEMQQALRWSLTHSRAWKLVSAPLGAQLKLSGNVWEVPLVSASLPGLRRTEGSQQGLRGDLTPPPVTWLPGTCPRQALTPHTLISPPTLRSGTAVFVRRDMKPSLREAVTFSDFSGHQWQRPVMPQIGRKPWRRYSIHVTPDLGPQTAK